MKHVIKNVHFVGIAGSGMSGIAEVMLNMGFGVSGSDKADHQATERLRALGAQIFIGHDAAHVQNAHVVVTSTAIKEDNPEVKEAHARLIPVVPRAVMLAELMRMKKGIAVAGTHGKTTTTSLVASVLAQAHLDPTFVIGGRLNSVGANARLGAGDYLVAEADESDASFLNLMPVAAVVTNIDEDHMETYGHDVHRLKNAFLDFLHRLPFYGAAIVCIDDAKIKEILPDIARPVVTYGFDEKAQLQALNVKAMNGKMHFQLHRKDPGNKAAHLDIELNLAGKHNVLNALAAIGVADELDIEDQYIVQALAQFKGVNRRFQQYEQVPLPSGGHVTLIDDYGHHPVEMAATLEAARGAFPEQRLVLAFQPHRYTRTRDCFEDFVRVISSADVALITEVYAAGEAPIAGADARALVRSIRLGKKIEPFFCADIDALINTLWTQAQDGDVILCMGAGSIGGVCQLMSEQANQLKKKEGMR